MRKCILAVLLLILAVSTSFAADLLDGLIGYWPFDGDTRDASGHGHGLSGSVSWTTDRNGQASSAAYFNGSSQLYLSSGVHAPNSMTLAVWIKPNRDMPTSQGESLSYTLGNLMPNSQYVLFPPHGGFNTSKAGVGIVAGQNGILVMEHANDYCPIPLAWFGNIGANWTFIAITISDNDAPILYVNGNYIKQGLRSSREKFFGETTVGGGSIVGNSHCYYSGAIDDLRVYKRALSASEIKALYNHKPTFGIIAFNANGGEGEMEEQMVVSGGKCTLPANTFTRNGCRFAGWSKTKDGTVAYQDGAEMTVTRSMTLYAVWEWEKVRMCLHGNGVTTEDGTREVDVEVAGGEDLKLPKNPFTKAGKVQGDVSEALCGWWPGSAAYDWRVHGEVGVWSKTGSVQASAKNVRYWLEHGWAEEGRDGVPTLHLYALWFSMVRVRARDGQGMALSPATLEGIVEYSDRYGQVTRTGDGEFWVPPGTQSLVVELASGYGERYTASVRENGTEIAPVVEGGNVWEYYISSSDGPTIVDLEIRVAPKTETGKIHFDVRSANLTVAQKQAWPIFPPFDEEKVQINLWPEVVTKGGGMNVSGMDFVEVPEGTYWAKITYKDLAGVGTPYWDTQYQREIAVKRGEFTPVTVRFLPFGSDEVNYCWIAFDGDGGTVKGNPLMWFGPYGSSCLIGFHFPSATRPDGWKFEGWWYPPQGKLVKTWQELDSLMKADLPGNLTLKPQWTNVANAATGTGTVVPHDWLANTASDALAAAGGDYEAAAAATAANGMAVWECYLAGLDPADEAASFKTELVQDEEKWKAKPVGGEKEGRVYRVEGKREMSDEEEWTDVTDVEDIEAEGWRFFRVGVELAE